MNLQELATIAHHRLPIKIVVFSNDGYKMIKRTQIALGLSKVAVDEESGVSFPDFLRLAESFNIPAVRVKDWADWDHITKHFFNYEGPMLMEVINHPLQPLVPKLDPIRHPNGKIESPRFDALSPRIA